MFMCYVTRRLDIPGYSMDLSTNKRVYRKLYSKKYKSSRKFCFKMLAASDPEEVWNVLLARILRLILLSD